MPLDKADQVRNYYRQQGAALERQRIIDILVDRICHECMDLVKPKHVTCAIYNSQANTIRNIPNE